MKNNQVYLDPNNLEKSVQDLTRFYNLDGATLQMLRRVIEKYPKPVIVYVDEANAPLHAQSILDDHFTFNTQTGELVLFSSDPMTFIDAIIEMWMYITGFDTLMGDDDYWKVELAIGSWKPVKNSIKQKLGIPVNTFITGIIGLPPEPDEAPPEDPYPFKTLVSQFDIVSFTQMMRLAGRAQVRVNFPPETDPRVKEAYFNLRRIMKTVGDGLDITDAEVFNKRLQKAIEEVSELYKPHELPIPLEWQSQGNDHDAASGKMGKTNNDDNDSDGDVLLGPPSDEPEYGQLPIFDQADTADDLLDTAFIEELFDDMQEIDDELEAGPFGEFIDTLFDD